MVKKILVSIVIILALGFGTWKYFQGKNKNIVSTQATTKTLEEKLTLAGQIDAKEKVTLRFRTPGKLMWVGVSENMVVKKGQAVARLDPANVDKDVSDAWYNYLAADANAKKVEDDLKNKDTTENFAEKNTRVTAQVAANKAYDAWLSARRDQKDSTLYSPISGVVTRVAAPYAGINLTLPTQAEFDITNPQTIYFSASADQTEIPKISAGREGQLVLDAYPESNITGIVKTISFIPKEGETSTVYTLEFIPSLSNMDFKYRLGMTGDLTFIIQKRENVLTLPAKFVHLENAKSFVYASTDHKIKKYIETGMETDDGTEIVTGLSENELVYE